MPAKLLVLDASSAAEILPGYGIDCR